VQAQTPMPPVEISASTLRLRPRAARGGPGRPPTRRHPRQAAVGEEQALGHRAHGRRAPALPSQDPAVYLQGV